jgi:hypothetical protein
MDLLRSMREDLPVPLFERPAEHVVTCEELLTFKDKAKADAVRTGVSSGGDMRTYVYWE